jgi:hypothetical protein
MAYQHTGLESGAWQKLSLMEQLANIGSEVGRTAKWHSKNPTYSEAGFIRALELFDLTLRDPRWRRRLREIARARELFVDAYFGGEEYHSSLEDMEKYFYPFAFAARRHH